MYSSSQGVGSSSALLSGLSTAGHSSVQEAEANLQQALVRDSLQPLTFQGSRLKTLDLRKLSGPEGAEASELRAQESRL